MTQLNFRSPHREAQDRHRLSGGTLPRDLTGAQRLALFVRARRLREDFYRRRAQR